ncbi:trehalose [Phyllosticta citribraziliensis]|uniref:Trehalase n=1 Tax=Phyllosticta citribraziliensis TaxID=989973 RepID=A0ABR1L2J0_9PEZI
MAPCSLLRTATIFFLCLSRVSAVFDNGVETTPCDSPLYCQGEILKAIQLAKPYDDSKTFVDQPTIRPLDDVIAAFDQLPKPVKNDSALRNFLDKNFGPAGGEIAVVPPAQLTTEPAFLDSVREPEIREFVKKVIDIWPDLTRSYVGAGSACDGCVSSFIPINRTFVVAGGRFREAYYWDSFWIIEGLLRTRGSFTQVAENIIENFLDLVEEFGFVPNGARVYYLNRSQPPLLTQMVKIYVDYTGNATILKRALPILVKEYDFWKNNRSVDVVDPQDGTTYKLNHYSVSNTQPRPESYVEDYETANNASYYAKDGTQHPGPALSDETRRTLYANLASGAESGWDYSSRWIANVDDAVTDSYFPLRSLNTREIVPVDLNSILYANEQTLAEFFNRTGDDVKAAAWEKRAVERSEAMFKLMWNYTHWSYFDFNLTSGEQNVFVPAENTSSVLETTEANAPAGKQLFFSPAQLYPFWTGAAPHELKDDPYAVRSAYSHVAQLLEQKPGGIAASNVITGQQWDEPNVWAPLQYVAIKGLLAVPAALGTNDDAYEWAQSYALEIGQRFVASTFCTWLATGGSTQSRARVANAKANGIIFEKYSDASINAVGGGGEYEVVEGFGWSNGLLIWLADLFGQNLTVPDCGNVVAAKMKTRDLGGGFGSARRPLNRISQYDRRWVKARGEGEGEEWGGGLQ